MIKTAFEYREVEKRAPLSEDEARGVLETILKQRREAASEFRKGGRPELADREEYDVDLIEAYLPAAATEDEIRAAVGQAIAGSGAAGMRDMGRVMKTVRGLLEAKTVDLARVSALVKEKLEEKPPS
jgi:hypothetical protein